MHPEAGSAVQSGELCMLGIGFLLNACMYFSALSWELQGAFVDVGILRQSKQDKQKDKVLRGENGTAVLKALQLLQFILAESLTWR